MSISPPTDIVLDVVRAVDPERYKQAVARLDRLSGAAETSFNDVLAGEATEAGPAASAGTATGGNPPASASLPPGRDAASVYQQFEAMALANLFEESMPDDAAGFFGDGVAGSTWKSMLMEQIATQMAKAGGIGIASELARGAQDALMGGEAASVATTRSLLTASIERPLLAALGTDPLAGDEALP
jgi:flagellar protein FlgJ